MITNFPSQENMNLYEGYLFSINRNHFNLIQMRVLMRIVEFAQAELEGLLIRENKCQIQHNLREVTLSIPASCLLSEGSKHYEQVHRSVKDMQKEILEYYNPKLNQWYSAAVIFNVEHSVNKGVIVFSVAQWVWDAILNFSRGYRKVELDVMMSLRSSNAMKMYQLMSGQKTPITYNIDWLKSYFGVADKYDQPTDFMRKVIAGAQKEVNGSCPVGFDYIPVKTGRKFTAITFKPYEQRDKGDQALRQKQMLSNLSASSINGNAWRYMRYQMGFDAVELNKNKQLLEDCTLLLDDFLGKLASIQGRRRTPDGKVKGKGWVIAALKAEVVAAHERETFH